MEKKRVPIKNIDPVFVDIKKPGFNYGHLQKFTELDLRRVPQQKLLEIKKKRELKFSFVAVCAAVCLALISGGVFLFLTFKSAKVSLAKTAETISGNFMTAAEDLKQFEPEKAEGALQKNTIEIQKLKEFLNRSYLKDALQVAEKLDDRFTNAESLLNKIDTFNTSLITLSTSVKEFQQKGFVAFKKDGREFLRILNDLKTNIETTNKNAQEIKNSISELKNTFPQLSSLDTLIGDKYVSYSASLYEMQEFLGQVANLIGSPQGKHILVIFQNPAEIRPSGGFIGSFADVTVREGQLYDFQVEDVYDYDGQFLEKVVPPEQLQSLTKNWGVRDSNWFFDFPTSAETAIQFLEKSKINEEKGIVFDGAIAININVLKSILGLVGPISLDGYKLVINEDNFLENIQREIEAGKDNTAGQPKKILKTLAPIILERLETLSTNDQKKLIEKIGEHADQKDIMAYMKDSRIENTLKIAGIDGSVFELPLNFWGTYLAVVNTNIAGGKSDAFMKETITGKIDIDMSGEIFTDLVIERTHNGGKEKDPWWNKPNKDYIQVYSAPNSNIILAKGNETKEKPPKYDYAAEGYSTYGPLKTIEDTAIFLPDFLLTKMDAFGKSVFATWFNVTAGQTKQLNIRYYTPSTGFDNATPGKRYTFVFDKQSGVESALDISITAPIKYKWKESGSAVFEYKNDNPNKRVLLTLTLEK